MSDSKEERSARPNKRRGLLVLVALGGGVVSLWVGSMLGVEMRPFLEYIVMFGLLAELIRCRLTSS